MSLDDVGLHEAPTIEVRDFMAEARELVREHGRELCINWNVAQKNRVLREQGNANEVYGGATFRDPTAHCYDCPGKGKDFDKRDETGKAPCFIGTGRNGYVPYASLGIEV